MSNLHRARDTISMIDGFDAMRIFLERYWERGGRQSDDLASLLTSLDRPIDDESLPLDAALWSDWLEAASK